MQIDDGQRFRCGRDPVFPASGLLCQDSEGEGRPPDRCAGTPAIVCTMQVCRRVGVHCVQGPAIAKEAVRRSAKQSGSLAVWQSVPPLDCASAGRVMV